jgi:hypothetical protein
MNIIGPLDNVVYGDQPGEVWCPETQCDFTATNYEFIEVEFQDSVFIQRVEVIETFNPGAVQRIWAWDNSTETWRLLSNAADITEAAVMIPEITLYAPSFCESTLQNQFFCFCCSLLWLVERKLILPLCQKYSNRVFCELSWILVALRAGTK